MARDARVTEWQRAVVAPMGVRSENLRAKTVPGMASAVLMGEVELYSHPGGDRVSKKVVEHCSHAGGELPGSCSRLVGIGGQTSVQRAMEIKPQARSPERRHDNSRGWAQGRYVLIGGVRGSSR